MKLFKPRSPDPAPEDENSIEGERALSSVNKGVTLQNRITNWAIVSALVGLTGVLLYKYYAGMYEGYKQSKVAPRDKARVLNTSSLPPLVVPDPEPVARTSAPAADDKLPPMQPPASSAPAGQAPVKTVAEQIRERRLKRELRFNLDGGAESAAGLVAAADPATLPAPAGTPATGAKAAQAAGFSAARAYMLPDPTLMVTRGAVIPCTLIPAVDTTLPGTVTCVTSQDVTGADNKVVLMDRGTFCVGRQGGGVTHGQRRVGIVWQRCETPQHVLVPLEAEATDALGRPGIGGTVDNHFWDRFGAAIALSLISDIGPYLVATRQGGGNNNTTIAFPNILNGPQQLMSEVLKSTADIPPTITAPQGARVLIFLNGDLDFRDVYQLERTK
jgi:type IV secretion system protein VirB10